MRYSLTGLTMVVALGIGVATLEAVESSAQQTPAELLHNDSAERTIRREIPLPNSVRRALAAGTRDSSGRPGPRYWQLWTDYTIHARLDPTTAIISGRETVVIHNPSDAPIRQVLLRLDQNLFRPDAVRATSFVVAGSDTTAGITITSLAIDGRALALNQVPGLTGTVATVPATIPAHGQVTLEAHWHFRVPKQGTFRMGHSGDSVYQVGQWYPRVMVYDDLHGWDREPYLGHSEFYNNYGRFDVTLDVPAGWLVGATGVLQNPEAALAPTIPKRLARVSTSDSVSSIVTAAERGPGRATAGQPGQRLAWRFVADTASDFAWAASDRYVWDAIRVAIPDRGSILVHFLYLPDEAAEYAKMPRIARHALEFYSSRIMPYAFPQLTAVQGNIPKCCMEYPMFVITGASLADHEIAHQWWPMMVSSNETWYAWMDETFDQYLGSRAIREGETLSYDGQGQAFGKASRRTRLAGVAASGSQSRVPTPRGDGAMVAMLSMLGAMVGDTTVYEALGAYSRAWRFKHPSPWDFMFFMNTALQQDLGWFWYYWMFSPTVESVDGSLASVITAGPQTTTTIRQAGGMPAPVILEVKFAPDGPALTLPQNAHLIDSVTALVTYPVEVWFDGRRTFEAVLDFGGRPVERLTLDPHGRFPDRNPADNVWHRPTQTP